MSSVSVSTVGLWLTLYMCLIFISKVMPAYYESKHAIGDTLADTSCGKLYDSRTWQAELGTAPLERAVSNVTKLKLCIDSNVGYTMQN
jgi:hypothetical protein